MTTPLPDHLSACYAEDVLHLKDKDGAFAALCSDLSADDALRADAQSHLSTLTDEICNRCFISTTHRRLLNAALAQP